MIRYSRLLLPAILCFCLAVSNALAAKPLTIHQFTLSNKLKVVVVPFDRAPVISHNLLFFAGASDDASGASGVAHYLEHLVFKGTPTHPEGEYSKRIEALGGQYNAFTSADMTGYYVTAAKEHLATIMELEADRMMNLSPSPEAYAKERQVILEERRLRIDTSPAALLSEAINAALFRHHPYGTPIIGWAHEMETLDEPEARAFLERFYSPANALLLLVGDIDEKIARSLAERYYGKWYGAPKQPRRWVKEPPRLASDEVSLRHPSVTSPLWTRSYIAESLGTSENDNQVMPLLIAEELLGNPRTGLLYQTLVKQQKLATSVSVSYQPFSIGPATFDVTIQPAADVSMQDITKAYEAAIAAFLSATPDKEAIERARNQMNASTIFAQDSIQGMAFIIGQLVMIGMEPEWFNRWESLVNGVTAEQITATIHDTLRHEISVTGYLLPASSHLPQKKRNNL